MNKLLSYLIIVLLSFIGVQDHLHTAPAAVRLLPEKRVLNIYGTSGWKDPGEGLSNLDPGQAPGQDPDKGSGKSKHVSNILCSRETLAAIDEEVVDIELLFSAGQSDAF